MTFPLIGWIDQVVKNQLESAYKTHLSLLQHKSNGQGSLGHIGQGNVFCAEDSVRIHVTRQRHAQIVEFHTKTSEAMVATIADATSRIRAHFSRGAIKDVAEQIGNPFSETAEHMADVSTIFNPEAMSSDRLYISVVKFGLESRESFKVFGGPAPVEKMHHLQDILGKWSAVLAGRSSTGSDSQPLDAANSLNLATQVAFDTHIPVTKPERASLTAHVDSKEKGGALLSILSSKALNPKQSVAHEPRNSRVLPEALQAVPQTERDGLDLDSSLSSPCLPDTEKESDTTSNIPHNSLSDRVRDSFATYNVHILTGSGMHTSRKSQNDFTVKGTESSRDLQDCDPSCQSTRPKQRIEGQSRHIPTSPGKAVILKAATDHDIVKIAAKLEAKANVPHDKSFPDLQSTGHRSVRKAVAEDVNSSNPNGGRSPALDDSEKENSQEHSHIRLIEAASQREPITTADVFDFLDHNLDVTPFDGMKRIPRSYARISEAQNAILERADSWVQLETSSGLPYANIPPGVLADLRSFIARNPDQASSSKEQHAPPKQKSLDGYRDKESHSDSEDINGADNEEPDGESESPHSEDVVVSDLEGNLKGMVGNIIDTNENYDKAQNDSDIDDDAASWPSSPVRYNCDEANEEPDDRNHAHALPKLKITLPRDFPSSSPNGDDELPLDVPHVIGEEIVESDDEMPDGPNGSLKVPSTLPQNGSMVQVKRTPNQDSRLSKPQASDETHLDGKIFPNSNERTSQVSSDPIIPATFMESCSGIAIGLNEAVTAGSSQLPGIAARSAQQHALPKGDCDEVEDESHEFLASQQLYTEIAGSQLRANRSPSTMWEQPSISKTPLQKDKSKMVSQANDKNLMINSPTLKRNAIAITSSSNGSASTRSPPLKRQKRALIVKIGFGEDSNDDDIPTNINEILRAERYKYKPSSDAQSSFNEESSLYFLGPTSAQPMKKEIPDSLESLEQSQTDTNPVLIIPEIGHPKLEIDNSSQQPDSINSIVASAEESSIQVEDLLEIEKNKFRPGRDVGVRSLPTTEACFPPVISPAHGIESISAPGIHLSERPPTSISNVNSIAPYATAYEKFKDTYNKTYADAQKHCTYYTGTRKEFTWALAYLDYIAQGKIKKFLKRNMWDDFIRVLAVDYRSYVQNALRLKEEDPSVEVLVGIEFYNDQDEEVMFKEMVITPENLQKALDSLEQEEVEMAKEAFKRPPKNIGFRTSSQSSTTTTPSQPKRQQQIVTSQTPTTTGNKATPNPFLVTNEESTLVKPRHLTTNGKRFFETHSQAQVAEPADENEDDEPEIQVLATTKPNRRLLPWAKSKISPPRLKDALPIVSASSPPITSFRSVVPLPGKISPPLRNNSRLNTPRASLPVLKVLRRRTTGTTTVVNQPEKFRPLQDIFFARSEYLRKRREGGDVSRPGTPRRKIGGGGSKSFG